MKLSNVFYGFTKDGKYRCLYKRYRTYDTDCGTVSATVYVDLENNCEFENLQVDEKTLQPITNLINGYKSKRKIVNAYKAKVDVEIPTWRFFYGDIVKYVCPYTNFGYVNIKDTTEITQQSNVLFMGTSNGFAKNIPEGQDYFIVTDKIEEVEVNKEFINNVKPLKGMFATHGLEISKRKVLEMDYKKEL